MSDTDTWLLKKVLDQIEYDGTTFAALRVHMFSEVDWPTGLHGTIQELYDQLHEGFLRALDYMLKPPCRHEAGWLAAEYLDGSTFVYCSICGEEDGLEKYGSP